MAYFVTGATGFIGRHLVERLLQARGRDPRARARGLARRASTTLIERWTRRRRGADRVKPVIGDLRRAAARRRRGAGRRAARQDRPLLPPRRDLRHDRRRRAQRRPLNVGGTRTRSSWRSALDAGASTTSPRSPSPASTRASSARTCSTRARSCPRPTTARSSSPSGSCASEPRCRGASTARRSSSATRAPARWTRSTGPTTSSRRSSARATCCRSGCRSSGPSSATRTSCRSTASPRAMDHIAHEPGPRRPGVPPHRPAPQRVGRGAQRVRQGRARAALAMRIDKRLTDALPKGRSAMLHAAAAAARGARARCCAEFGHPRGGARAHGAVPRFDTRDTERALAGTGIEVAARWRRYAGQAVGLLGAQPRPRPVRGPLASRARSTASTSMITGASIGHRPRRRAEGRRRRRRPAARRAQRREARGGARRDRGRGRHRVRVRRRHLRHGVDRRARRASARRPPRRRHARQQRRAARSAARSRSATTASTTSSARCSSTTSARSS